MRNVLKAALVCLICTFLLSSCSLFGLPVTVLETGGDVSDFPSFEVYFTHNLSQKGAAIQGETITKVPEFGRGMNYTLRTQALHQLRDSLNLQGEDWVKQLREQFGQAVETYRHGDEDLILFDSEKNWTCFLGERRLDIPKTTADGHVLASCYRDGYWYWCVEDGFIRIDCTAGTWEHFAPFDITEILDTSRPYDWGARSFFSPNPDSIGIIYNYITSAMPPPWETVVVLYNLVSGEYTPIELDGGCLAVYPREDGTLLAVTAPHPEDTGTLSFVTVRPSGEILSEVTCTLPKEHMRISAVNAAWFEDGKFYTFGDSPDYAQDELLLFGCDSATGELIGWERIKVENSRIFSTAFELNSGS